MVFQDKSRSSLTHNLSTSSVFRRVSPRLFKYFNIVISFLAEDTPLMVSPSIPLWMTGQIILSRYTALLFGISILIILTTKLTYLWSSRRGLKLDLSHTWTNTLHPLSSSIPKRWFGRGSLAFSHWVISGQRSTTRKRKLQKGLTEVVRHGCLCSRKLSETCHDICRNNQG